MGDIFLKEMKPVLGPSLITVTQVRITPDLAIARIYVSIMVIGNGTKEGLMQLIRENTSDLRRRLGLREGKQLRIIDFRLQSYHLSFGKNMSVRVSPDVKLSAMERMKRSFALRDENAVELRAAIDTSPANLIVCGDMNDVSSSHVYRLIKGNDLIDAWADVGRGYAPTFNRHHLPFRIDHVFYRGDIPALMAERITGGASDHYPLMVTFDIDK